MTALAIAVLFVLIGVPSASALPQETGALAPHLMRGEPLPELPLSFERNEGQYAPGIRFVARGADATFVLRDAPAMLEVRGRGGRRSFYLDLAGLRRGVRPEGIERAAAHTNYLLGSDPARWHSHIPSFSSVRYRNVYPGVDVRFYGIDGKLEYDFELAPGASVSDIRFRYRGADRTEFSGSGELRLLEQGRGWLTQRAPVIYQNDGGHRRPVAGGYARQGRDFVFQIASHDSRRQLVIDPVIEYSSLFGGVGIDFPSGMARDNSGNLYVAGTTQSTDFPSTHGTPPADAGKSNVFVMKLSSAGELMFSTVIGGTDHDGATAVAVDAAGAVYVAGWTMSNDFPTVNAAQGTRGGGEDGFVLKLSTDGSSVTYATFLGGRDAENITGMALAPSGTVWLAGFTYSSDFPLAAPLQSSFGGGVVDAFVARLSADGSRFLMSSYLGGRAVDEARDVAADSAGAAYISGKTQSADFPTVNPFQSALRGGEDAFLMKLDAEGRAVVFSTYFGGSNQEQGQAVAVDANSNVYLGGFTRSSDLPLESPADESFGGGQKAFVARFNPSGNALGFSTYLGGSRGEEVTVLAIDGDANLLVGGATSSPDFPLLSPVQSRPGPDANNNYIDGYVVRYDPQGRLNFATVIGGSVTSEPAPADRVYGIATAPDGSIFVAGSTRSDDFPRIGARQTPRAGQADVFLMKLAPEFTGSGEMRVVPVVASSPGSLGSFFRTSVQLHNPGDEAIGGKLIFHRQGQEGSDSDPSLSYFLGARQTLEYADMLPAMGTSGSGSLDVISLPGEAPHAVVRIFNDAGEAGTTGMSEDLQRPQQALGSGTRTVLLAPPDMGRYRYNIGVRTLAEGATLNVTVRRADGTVAATLPKQFPANYFAQVASADFLGIALAGNESIEIAIETGSAFLYGASTDNITQDPSAQFAREVIEGTAGTTRIIPVVASAEGAFGSFFRSSVQLHNPFGSAISGRIVFHPQGTSGSESDPSLEYTLQPRETRFYADLLPEMGRSGTGSADLISTGGGAPVAVIRVFNEAGEAGTTGLTQELVAIEEGLGAGERGVLIAPLDPSKSRFNIAVRTLAAGATIELVVRSASGVELKRVTKTYGPQFFQQLPSETLLEMTISGSDTVTVRVQSGRAIVYGSTTDNKTQDPSMQLLRPLAN